ncbi:MAG: hypothetical protein OHK0044_28140 [Burkholderiaceae bacterium]
MRQVVGQCHWCFGRHHAVSNGGPVARSAALLAADTDGKRASHRDTRGRRPAKDRPAYIAPVTAERERPPRVAPGQVDVNVKDT